MPVNSDSKSGQPLSPQEEIFQAGMGQVKKNIKSAVDNDFQQGTGVNQIIGNLIQMAGQSQPAPFPSKADNFGGRFKENLAFLASGGRSAQGNNNLGSVASVINSLVNLSEFQQEREKFQANQQLIQQMQQGGGQSEGGVGFGAELAGVDAGGNPRIDFDTQSEIFERENKLSKQFSSDKVVQNFDVVASQFLNIESSLQEALNTDNKIAADQALIVGFNKLIDPGSVVRESEFARSPQAAAAFRRIEGFVRKVSEGGVGITDDDRRAVVSAARKLYLNTALQFNGKIEKFEKLAKKAKVSREGVLGDVGKINVFKSLEDAESAELPAGTELWVRSKNGNFRKAVVE